MANNPTRSDLDQQQILQRSFDEDNDRLRVEADITAPIDLHGDLLVSISAQDDDSVLVYGTQDGTSSGTQQILKINSDGSTDINNITGTVSLPTGAATSANQTTEITQLTAINANTDGLEGLIGTTNSTLSTIDSDLNTFKTANHNDLGTLHTDNITIESKIDTTNTTLTTIDSDLNSFKTANHSDLTTLHNDLITVKSKQDTGNTSLSSINSNQTNGTQQTKLVDGSGNVVGPAQSLSGTNYLPIVSAASATPGSASVAQSIQIAGSDGTNARTISTDNTGKININNISGTVSLPTGAATETTLASIKTLLTVDFISGLIEVPQNKTYTLDPSSVSNRTINTLYIVSSSGTCTAALTINGVNITNLSGISVTSTPQEVAATALNTEASGDSLALVITNVSATINLSFRVKFTRTS